MKSVYSSAIETKNSAAEWVTGNVEDKINAFNETREEIKEILHDAKNNMILLAFEKKANMARRIEEMKVYAYDQVEDVCLTLLYRYVWVK